MLSTLMAHESAIGTGFLEAWHRQYRVGLLGLEKAGTRPVVAADIMMASISADMCCEGSQ